MKPIIISLFLCLTASAAFANDTYVFNCKDSSVGGQIKYAVIGAYAFKFKNCSGSLIFDPLKNQVKSVTVQIKINSITSNCPFCNKIVVSKRLLNASIFPFISYHSDSLEKRHGLYIAHGTINLHGISRDLTSPFNLKQISPGHLTIKGDWPVNRHDFDIIWNKLLDHGGVLVGETVKVNWLVHAHKKS